MFDSNFDGYSDFAEDDNWLVAKYQEFVENFPSPLNSLGKEYLQRSGGCPYTAKYLPFWVGDIYRVPRDLCRSIALSACFACVYVRLGDQIMDENSSEKQWERLLPFGTIALMEMMRQYRSLFPPTSPFWNYLEQYIAEWLQSISWEETNHWGKLQDYNDADLLLIARKAAVLKLSAMPVALLAGHEDAVELLARYIDHTMVVYDLLDQLKDWRQDLQAGHYGYLLTKVILGANWSESSPPPQDFVQRAFLFTNTVDLVISTAIKYARLAEDCAVQLKGQYLIGFSSRLIRLCEQVLEQWVIIEGQAFKDIIEASQNH